MTLKDLKNNILEGLKFKHNYGKKFNWYKNVPFSCLPICIPTKGRQTNLTKFYPFDYVPILHVAL